MTEGAYTGRVGQAPTDKSPRPGRVRSAAPYVAVAVLVLAVAGPLAYVLVTDDSSSSTSRTSSVAAATPPATTPAGTTSSTPAAAPSTPKAAAKPLPKEIRGLLATQALRGHALITPECQPFKGRR